MLGLRQQILNQHHALLHEQQTVPSVLARQQDLVATLDAQLTAVEAELTTLVAADSTWAASVRLFQTIPGVGHRRVGGRRHAELHKLPRCRPSDSLCRAGPAAAPIGHQRAEPGGDWADG